MPAQVPRSQYTLVHRLPSSPGIGGCASVGVLTTIPMGCPCVPFLNLFLTKSPTFIDHFQILCLLLSVVPLSVDVIPGNNYILLRYLFNRARRILCFQDAIFQYSITDLQLCTTLERRPMFCSDEQVPSL